MSVRMSLDIAAICALIESHLQMKSKSSIDWTARDCIPQTIALVPLVNNGWKDLAADAVVCECWRITPRKKLSICLLCIHHHCEQYLNTQIITKCGTAWYDAFSIGAVYIERITSQLDVEIRMCIIN